MFKKTDDLVLRDVPKASESDENIKTKRLGERDENSIGVKSIVALRPGRRGRLKEQTAPRNLPSKWALEGQRLLHFLDSLKFFGLFCIF